MQKYVTTNLKSNDLSFKRSFTRSTSP